MKLLRYIVFICILPISIVSKSQCACTGGGANLVVNGDFSAGNTGFTSGYAYVSGCTYTGGGCTFTSSGGCNYTSGGGSSYGVGNISSAFFPGWGDYLDHTCGCCSGSFMVVNGSCCANEDTMWRETIGVSPNTNYIISFWVLSINNSEILQIAINGTNVGTPYNSPNQTKGTWVQYCQTWNSGSNTSAAICILDETFSGGSNDFGVDDISFQTTGGSGCNSTVVLSSTNVTCFGNNNGNASIALSNGCTPPYTYMWSPSGQTTSAATSLSAGTYTVAVVNANTCTVADTVVIITQPAQVAPAITSIKNPICLGYSDTLVALGGATYLWNNSSSSTSSSITVTPNSNTTYSVIITNGACSKDTSITITVDSLKATITGPVNICLGDMTTLVSSGGSVYLWSNNLTTSSITVNPTVRTTYSATITRGACEKDTSVTITVNPLPIADINSSDTVICKGKSSILTASGGNTYSWNNNATSSSITIAPDSTATYTVTVTNQFNCHADTSIRIKVALPMASLTGPSYLCSGDSITLTAKGGGTYKWSTGNTNSSITIHPMADTTYHVIISNVCIDTITRNISVDNPGFYACCDTTLYAQGMPILLTASGATNYSWAPDSDISCTTCPNPIVAPSVTTTYTVIGTDSLSCNAIRTVTVDVDNCFKITIPNVFTPNGDNKNDDFVIPAQFTSDYSITIYDRWGKEVYQSNNPNAYWNGINQNDNNYVSNGVYYYSIKYSCTNKSFTKDGYVQVIR